MKKILIMLLIVVVFCVVVWAGLDAKSGKIINVATPTASTDAANKQYVDDTAAAEGHNMLSTAHGDTTTDAVTRGSLIYGNSTPAWDELVLGASGTILRSDGTDAGWSATTNITALGTIATGTWQATDVGVQYGGTGASTLTDGGILLGSGTSAITAMSVLADGSIVIGDGTTDPVALAAFTSSTGDLKHEAGGVEADVSSYSGLVGISGGTTSDVNTFSELNTLIADKTLVNEEDAVAWDSLGTFSAGVTIATGQALTIGTTTWTSSDEMDGTKIKDADYGDIAISAGGAWTLDGDCVDESHIADDGIDSEHYNDGSIDLVHLAAAAYAKDIVTTAPITGGTDNVLIGADADITIAIPVATTDANGYLSQTDWDTFNDHAADSSQAHTDYLINNGNDSTSGALTMAGLVVDTTTLVVDSVNHRVGIGTANPGAMLEIQSSSPVLRLRDTGATAGATTAFVEFGGTNAGAWSRTGHVGDGASANTDIYLQAEISDLHLGDSSGNSVMNLQGGNVGIGLTTVDANYKLIIRRAANVNLGIGLQSSELAIAAFNDALSANIPMRFYASEFNLLNGNVGINETAPQDKLEVNGTILVKDKLKFTQDDGNEYIDSLADGYMDYGATTAHRFNNPIEVSQVGIAADTDLLQLANGVLTVNGTGTFANLIATSSSGITANFTQSGASAAEPVLELDQDDTNYAFADFVGTAGGTIGTSITNSGSFVGGQHDSGDNVCGPMRVGGGGFGHVGMIKIQINGTDFWIPYYTFFAP